MSELSSREQSKSVHDIKFASGKLLVGNLSIGLTQTIYGSLPITGKGTMGGPSADKYSVFYMC